MNLIDFVQDVRQDYDQLVPKQKHKEFLGRIEENIISIILTWCEMCVNKWKEGKNKRYIDNNNS